MVDIDAPRDRVAIRSAAEEVVSYIVETFGMPEGERHYMALVLEAKAGEPNIDPEFLRLARDVAAHLREFGK